MTTREKIVTSGPNPVVLATPQVATLSPAMKTICLLAENLKRNLEKKSFKLFKIPDHYIYNQAISQLVRAFINLKKNPAWGKTNTDHSQLNQQRKIITMSSEPCERLYTYTYSVVSADKFI